MSALDRPVRVFNHTAPEYGKANVYPSDVVAAHNAQTEDPADHLVPCRHFWPRLSELTRERDEARAETVFWEMRYKEQHRTLHSLEDVLDEARAEVERLRETVRTMHRASFDSVQDRIAREALGKQ